MAVKNKAVGCVLYQRPDRNSREEEGQGRVGMPRSQTQHQQYCCTNVVKNSYRIKGAAGNSGLLALVSANRHDAGATGRTHEFLLFRSYFLNYSSPKKEPMPTNRIREIGELPELRARTFSLRLLASRQGI